VTVVLLFALVVSVLIALWGLGTAMSGLRIHRRTRTRRGLVTMAGGVVVAACCLTAVLSLSG
jgi:hypothetical protein